jgi:isopentenyl diphosphate isomerase/L-lactate dehydrogenase-like FMN-dependent dehydrogenase
LVVSAPARIALGASAVMAGQPIMHALAVADAADVAHLLTILRAGFEAAMVLTGRVFRPDRSQRPVEAHA